MWENFEGLDFNLGNGRIGFGRINVWERAIKDAISKYLSNGSRPKGKSGRL